MRRREKPQAYKSFRTREIRRGGSGRQELAAQGYAPRRWQKGHGRLRGAGRGRAGQDRTPEGVAAGQGGGRRAGGAEEDRCGEDGVTEIAAIEAEAAVRQPLRVAQGSGTRRTPHLSRRYAAPRLAHQQCVSSRSGRRE